jgi:hypothetical protein
VNAQFITDLASLGLKRLTADDLVRARDHGVSPAWVRVINSRNRSTLSIDELLGLRDQGVETLQELRRRT